MAATNTGKDATQCNISDTIGLNDKILKREHQHQRLDGEKAWAEYQAERAGV
jgi:hypothetical protein